MPPDLVTNGSDYADFNTLLNSCAAQGRAIGLVSARELSPWMAGLLFGVKPFDPLT